MKNRKHGDEDVGYHCLMDRNEIIGGGGKSKIGDEDDGHYCLMETHDHGDEDDGHYCLIDRQRSNG